MSQEKIHRELLRLVAEAKSESLVLQTICAVLLAEISILSKENPREKLGKMLAGLQGLAAGVVAKADGDTQIITSTIERVSAMAEAALGGPRSAP